MPSPEVQKLLDESQAALDRVDERLLVLGALHDSHRAMFGLPGAELTPELMKGYELLEQRVEAGEIVF